MPKYKLVKKEINEDCENAKIQSGGVFAMYSPFEDTIQVGNPVFPVVPMVARQPTPGIIGPKIKLHRKVPLVTVPVVPTVPSISYGCNKPFYSNIQCSKNIPVVTPKPCYGSKKIGPCDKDIVDIFLEKFKNKSTIYSPLSDDIPPTLS